MRRRATIWICACIGFALLLNANPLLAQETPAQKFKTGPSSATITPETPLSPSSTHDAYVLAAGDQIVIHAFEMEDINDKPYLIDNEGNVRIPMLGTLKAAGQTVADFQKHLIDALAKYVQQPQVTVTVTQFHTEPVFLLGSFKAPGVYTLEGKRTLVDMLAISGGLLPDASLQIKLTRRVEYGPIPLPGAVKSPDGKSESVTINLVSIGETANPAENIFVQPYDVISVDTAEMIYVDGQFARPSGVAVNQKTSMSLLQILSLSGGTTTTAKGKAWILRPIPNSKRRTRIDINLNRIVEGKDPDVDLYPNDFVYLPATSALLRNIGTGARYVLPVATGLIYLAFR
jgi:polysaccharide export outer membrane protein